MFGEYKIEKGDYLFTLSNLINKKFVLNPGEVSGGMARRMMPQST